MKKTNKGKGIVIYSVKEGPNGSETLYINNAIASQKEVDIVNKALKEAGKPTILTQSKVVKNGGLKNKTVSLQDQEKAQKALKNNRNNINPDNSDGNIDPSCFG